MFHNFKYKSLLLTSVCRQWQAWVISEIFRLILMIVAILLCFGLEIATERQALERCAQCSPNRTKTITTKNMELERTLSNMEFPLCYQNVIADINLEKANDFVKAMLNTIVNKYGSITVKNEIERDSSNSPISNHLTHIIEVGGLKIISDNKLYKNRQDEFQDIIVSVVFVLNCSLAIELKNLNLYNGDTSNYYGNDAILTIAKRLAKHTNDGINYSNGFEYYSNIMVIENLLNKITN